jgi:microcystin degradation protein MlrC
MRLFTATLATETNTFSPLPTSIENYRESVFCGRASIRPMRRACARRHCSSAGRAPSRKASS